MAVTFSHAHMFRCMTVAEKCMASGSLAPRFPCALMSWCLYKGTNTCTFTFQIFVHDKRKWKQHITMAVYLVHTHVVVLWNISGVRGVRNRLKYRN